MSDSQDSIDNELKIKIPKRARFIAIGWLFTCGVIFSFFFFFSFDNTIHLFKILVSLCEISHNGKSIGEVRAKTLKMFNLNHKKQKLFSFC